MQESTYNNSSWVTATLNLWIERKINLESGMRDAEIEATELAVGIEFPAEMKELYRVVNGFRNYDMDTDSMISIWPTERIREEYLGGKDKNFVGFCDFLICSHMIGFFKDRKGIYKEYDELNPIAESFRQVVDFINNNPDVLI